ncbi:hypothetical protein [Limnohabitans sp.]|uniref:hypothetical protein n=1 Tax=Limnohabitans sp. TaxID=1907725 RepID=UPI0037C03DCB
MSTTASLTSAALAVRWGQVAPGHGTWGLAWVIAVAVTCWPLAVRAADSSAATSALKALLGSDAVSGSAAAQQLTTTALVTFSGGAALAPAGPAMPAPPGPTITVQRGDTLDRVIARTLPNVPLRADFLRKAFVALNPQAFPSGSAHLMRAGTTLQVPSMAVLRHMLLQQHPATGVWFEPQADDTVLHKPGDKRRWVRFP